MAAALPPSTNVEVEHEFVEVDEFDALSIQVRTSVSPSKVPDAAKVTCPKYPAKLHAQKVAAELDVQDGIVFLPGEPSTVYEDSDMGPAFRQRRYFYYLSGANFADCAVTYELDKDRLILWIPFVEPRQVLWYGSTPGIDECLTRYDVDDVRYTRELDKFLGASLGGGAAATLYVLHPNQAPDLGGLAAWLPRGQGRGGIGMAAVSVDTTSLRPAMDEARVVKTEYEVAMIRRANEVSSEAHRKVAERLLEFTNERQVEALFQATCTDAGTRTQAYSIIAGSGTNAATLHYDENSGPLKPNQLLVLDAGCEWECYASDITRTLPVHGYFTPEAAAIHRIVQRMQDEVAAQVRPGVVYYGLHVQACAVALAGLHLLGILVGDVAAIWKAGTVAAFFPHGLGHHVGLETHDVTGNTRLLMLPSEEIDESRGAGPGTGTAGSGRRGRRSKRELVTPEMLTAMMETSLLSSQNPPPYKGRQMLKKNMILTIEPGIYFCREYIEGYFLSEPSHARFIDVAVLERYYPVGGCRIEDDFLVTEDGYENLTTAPKGEELLRIINGKG